MVNRIGQKFIILIPISAIPHLPLSGPICEAQILFTSSISSNHCVRLRAPGAASACMFVPLARNAIPATPARFMYRFSCICMYNLWARQLWSYRRSAIHFGSCGLMQAYALWCRSKKPP